MLVYYGMHILVYYNALYRVCTPSPLVRGEEGGEGREGEGREGREREGSGGEGRGGKGRGGRGEEGGEGKEREGIGGERSGGRGGGVCSSLQKGTVPSQNGWRPSQINSISFQ